VVEREKELEWETGMRRGTIKLLKTIGAIKHSKALNSQLTGGGFSSAQFKTHQGSVRHCRLKRVTDGAKKKKETRVCEGISWGGKRATGFNLGNSEILLSL